MDGFDEFWAAYPRKVGKLGARRKYDRALKLTDHATIMAGVERYKANKPDYADWCHPSTWLHNGRWDDEYDTAPASSGLSPQLERSLRGGLVH